MSNTYILASMSRETWKQNDDHTYSMIDAFGEERVFTYNEACQYASFRKTFYYNSEW